MAQCVKSKRAMLATAGVPEREQSMTKDCRTKKEAARQAARRRRADRRPVAYDRKVDTNSRCALAAATRETSQQTPRNARAPAHRAPRAVCPANTRSEADNAGAFRQAKWHSTAISKERLTQQHSQQQFRRQPILATPQRDNGIPSLPRGSASL